MNPLVKKEIRLLLPAWGVAMLLALVQVITRPYDFYVASLLFFGLALMSLSTIGRETSLNTFSSLLSQPEERERIWKIKLSVLLGAFLSVFIVWLLAYGIALLESVMGPTDSDSAYYLFITICLIAAATFTGGLWSTLLLRQLAGAFWLTLLVPAVLSGIAAVFFADSESDSLVIAVLAIVVGLYSLAGFFFARWLFFRAQDVGWTGGTLVLPEWKIFGRTENVADLRRWKPIAASIKKELQLQQISLLGAAGLLVLHVGVLVLRNHHQFKKDSAGEVLTSIFWMIWLVLPVVMGATAIAEERKLGVMESQLCLPLSRRRQFAIKAFLVIVLGTLLGGVIPMAMERVAIPMVGNRSLFSGSEMWNFTTLPVVVTGLAGWLALLSLFASSLTKSFLQAVGFALATFFGCALLFPVFTQGRMFFFDAIPRWSALPMLIAIPTFTFTLLWLASLNFKNFHEGWPLWRRNVLGLIAAFAFTIYASVSIYNRVWEVLEPAEPPHGPARLSLASPPVLKNNWGNLQVRLPDGRMWTDHFMWPQGLSHFWQNFFRPQMPKSPGYVEGSNWTSLATAYVGGSNPGPGKGPYAGYLNSVGIKPDGTLWISRASKDGSWTGNDMRQYGSETNWRQVILYGSGVMLLKNNGTLWFWGTNQLDFSDTHSHWPDLRDHPISQIGSDNDWAELADNDNLVQKSDGTVWSYYFTGKENLIRLDRRPELDAVPFKTFLASGSGDHAYVRANGTLWMSRASRSDRNKNNDYTEFIQIGSQTNWVSAVVSWRTLTALRADGTIWQWDFPVLWGSSSEPDAWLDHIQDPPHRIGIHNDWVALAGAYQDIIALAADGSLWYWPNHFTGGGMLAPPKQPQFLGNVLDSN